MQHKVPRNGQFSMLVLCKDNYSLTSLSRHSLSKTIFWREASLVR